MNAQHTVEFLMEIKALPANIVWKEPYAWTNGKPSHFKVYSAHVATHKVPEGFVYVVRRCSLKVPPPEEPQ